MPFSSLIVRGYCNLVRLTPSFAALPCFYFSGYWSPASSSSSSSHLHFGPYFLSFLPMARPQYPSTHDATAPPPYHSATNATEVTTVISESTSWAIEPTEQPRLSRSLHKHHQSFLQAPVVSTHGRKSQHRLIRFSPLG